MVKSHFCGLTMLLFFACQDLKKVEKFKCWLSRYQMVRLEKNLGFEIPVITAILGST